MPAKIHRGALCISRLCLVSIFLSINLVPLFHSARAQDSATAVSLQDSAAPTQSSLKSFFASGQSDRPAFLNDPKLLEAFYANRDFLPAWSGSTEAANAVAKVRSSLSDAAMLGLDSAQYFSGNTPPDRSIAPGRDAAIYDVLMTDALLRYANDLVNGVVSPNDVYKDARLPQSKFNASAALTLALKTNSIESLLVNLPPTHPEHSRLALALSRYRSIAAKGGWPALSGLQAQNDQSAAALYARLAMEDSTLHAVDKPTSAQLENAIKRYQIRNGLTPSGIVNSDMLSELNVPVTSRIQQILANLERWRWLPNDFESRYVVVNIPDQSLEFIRNNQVVLTSHVIVGRRGSPTPILRTVARSIVANPPWDIPADIAANQLLPHLKQNPNYLAAHNMIVVNAPGDPHGRNIPWSAVSSSNFPYSIRQLPPRSALGVLMLDSPNRFDVYLHDTPAKQFFSKSDREISNGCVRVEEIMSLASLALTNSPSAGLAQLHSAIDSHETRRIMLDEPLPIYMLYWTAIADVEGNVGFRPDRYHRDPPLIAALEKRSQSRKSQK